MKKVSFKVQENNKELIDCIVNFLIKNGMGKRFADNCLSVNSDGNIALNFNCSNSDYSRAIGLFILLSSDCHAPFCLEFRPYLIFHIHYSNNREECIKYINKN